MLAMGLKIYSLCSSTLGTEENVRKCKRYKDFNVWLIYEWFKVNNQTNLHKKNLYNL